MVELTTSAGLPPPEIEDAGGGVTVRFRHSQQQAILALLDREDDGLTLREIRARLASNTSERQVRRALTVLRDRGLVVSTGPGPAARWKRVRGQ